MLVAYEFITLSDKTRTSILKRVACQIIIIVVSLQFSCAPSSVARAVVVVVSDA